MISNIKFFIDLPKDLSLVSSQLAVELLKQAKMAHSAATGVFARIIMPMIPIWGLPPMIGMWAFCDPGFKGKIDEEQLKTMAKLGFLSLVIYSGVIFYMNRRKVAILEKLITDLTKIANQSS